MTDYLAAVLPPAGGRTLFIGNPPYVRHHALGDEAKARYAAACSRLGVPGASRLAGLHLHFLVHTGEIARRGDLAVFLTSAEWLETNYGKTLRRLLCGAMGIDSLHIVDARNEAFPGVQTTAAITVFRPLSQAVRVAVQPVGELHELGRLDQGEVVPMAAAMRVGS